MKDKDSQIRQLKEENTILLKTCFKLSKELEEMKRKMRNLLEKVP